MRPGYCPIGNEPCQSLCDKPCTRTPQRKPPNAKDFEDYCKTLHPLWNTRISRTEAEGFFHAGWLAAHGIKGEQ